MTIAEISPRPQTVTPPPRLSTLGNVSTEPDLTGLLRAWSGGDTEALAALASLVQRELREMARRKLPKGLFEFVDRGTEDEVALRNNRMAFGRIKMKPRTLVEVSRRSLKLLDSAKIAAAH